MVPANRNRRPTLGSVRTTGGVEMGENQQEQTGGDASEGEGAFDANAFEHAQEAEKLSEMKDKLTSVVTSHKVEGVGETPVTGLDILSSRWRQTAAQILKKISPDDYAKYRDMKYPDGDGSKPDLATRKKAYAFAVRRFLDLTYTEIEPDEPTKAQAIGEGWRQQAVKVLHVIDPEGYKEYRQRKYGTSETPDLKTRKAAYAFAVARFLEASYKLAGV
jgi:hypothetical protein